MGGGAETRRPALRAAAAQESDHAHDGSVCATVSCEMRAQGSGARDEGSESAKFKLCGQHISVWPQKCRGLAHLPRPLFFFDTLYARRLGREAG